MIIFLYLGGIISFLVVFALFTHEWKTLKRKKFPKEKVYEYMASKIFVKIFVLIAVSMTITFLLPSALWVVSQKEVTYSDKTDEKDTIFPMDENEQYYASLSNGSYIVFTNNEGKKLSVKQKITSIVFIDSTQQPHIDKIGHYKKVRVLSDSYLLTAANNMFSTDFTEAPASTSAALLKFDKGWNETLVSYYYKLYLPKGSIKQ